MQMTALRALARLAAEGETAVSARRLGAETGQSSDGAAATLGGLVRRGLVEYGKRTENREMVGYRLTARGSELGAR